MLSLLWNVLKARLFIVRCVVQTERREQHLTPGKFTPMKLPEGAPEDGGPVLEMSRHRLRVVEKLGEGLFGMVSSLTAYTYLLK